MCSGVHLDAQNVDGETALHFLTRRLRSTKAIEAMLLAGASTEKRRCNGYTPLIYALHSGEEDNATVLLNAGADANVQDEQGRNLLHFAIASRNISVEFIGQLSTQIPIGNIRIKMGTLPCSKLSN